MLRMSAYITLFPLYGFKVWTGTFSPFEQDTHKDLAMSAKQFGYLKKI
jgi:hypothetical protein